MNNTLKFNYINWKGEESRREVIPLKMHLGTNRWHPEKQWLLTAFDVNKEDVRDFAIKDITGFIWQPTLK